MLGIRFFYILLFSYITLMVTSCNKNANVLQLKQVEGYALNIDTTIAANNEIEQIIAPYRDKLSSRMNKVIGSNLVEMNKEQPESNLGNFNADAILYAARLVSKDTVHAAISNYGGMRIPSVTKGDIKMGTLYELMPFDNMLVVIDMSGKELAQYLTHTINGGGWPISKELNILADTLNNKHTFKINDEPLVENKKYRVCTSDYLANGGDDCSFLKPLQHEALGVFFRNGLISYVEQTTANGQPIKAIKDGRFEYAK